MSIPPTPIEPDLEPAFDVRIEYGPIAQVGPIATGGERSYRPVIGGSFEGEGLAGRLLGGGETHLLRADGVAQVEASYLIDLGHGASVRAFGNGYVTAEGDFRGMRLPLLFEAAQAGPAAALATRAFVAEQPAETGIMTIHRIV